MTNSTLRATLFCFIMSTAFSAHATINRFYKVQDGLYRGSQPTTDSDFQRLQKRGVTVLVSLRSDDDSLAPEEAMAKKYGMEVVSFPMEIFSEPSARGVSHLLEMIANRSTGVFVHCRQGKDRTGLIIALYEIHKMGWKAEKAYKEMRAIGFNWFLFPLKNFFWDHSKVGTL